MPELWNYEWPNVNTQRRYPLAEGVPATTGDFVLPNDFLADLVLSVNAGVSPPLNPELFHVAQVGVFSGGVVVSFGYNGTPFASVSIPAQGFEDYSVYTVLGSGAFYDTVGWVTIGRLDAVMSSPGAWTFTVDAARLTPTVIRPSLRAVSSIAVQSPGGQLAAYTGDIVLQAGANMRVRAQTSGEQTIITFDAIETAGFSGLCECDDLTPELPCIRTINGVPGVNGNIELVGETCISVSAGSNGVLLKDTCADPCCDCHELQVVTDTIAQMEAQIQTLEDSASRMAMVVNNLADNVLTSKLTGIVPRDSLA